MQMQHRIGRYSGEWLEVMQDIMQVVISGEMMQETGKGQPTQESRQRVRRSGCVRFMDMSMPEDSQVSWNVHPRQSLEA